ncbi:MULTISPECIES: hypothetical protein [unclassified Afipia]|uniref:hypothetical protein n=1 Tax=unclassified Afipia TaxID=2642050 RepID=UPI00041258D6|nr:MULTISPECIES: hypothetical protein [unclassified Afipia]
MTGAIGSGLHPSSRRATRVLRLAALLLGVGLVLGTGPVHAQDPDSDENKTFEEKLMDNLMSGLGGKKLEDGSIEYRERSPLVVPSKIDLPPPQSGKPKYAPNWPKDPDVAERAAARERAKQKAMSPEEARMPLMPSELNKRAPRSKTAESNAPGNNNSNSPLMMLPSELGYTGGLFSNPFSSNTKTETEKFTSEPERTELTQPPTGYQTPSSNYAYGVGQLKPPREKCDAASGRCEKTWD